MKRVWLQSLLVMAVVWAVCGTGTPAQAQFYGGYAYGPVVTYRPAFVAPPVVYSQPYVAYSAPYAYGPSPYAFGGYGIGGGYAYGVGPAYVRDRYNYGLFGHYNHHHHAHGPGFGHHHSHYRGW